LDSDYNPEIRDINGDFQGPLKSKKCVHVKVKSENEVPFHLFSFLLSYFHSFLFLFIQNFTISRSLRKAVLRKKPNL
jgi:hypothetical protein